MFESEEQTKNTTVEETLMEISRTEITVQIVGYLEMHEEKELRVNEIENVIKAGFEGCKMNGSNKGENVAECELNKTNESPGGDKVGIQGCQPNGSMTQNVCDYLQMVIKKQ